MNKRERVPVKIVYLTLWKRGVGNYDKINEGGRGSSVT